MSSAARNMVILVDDNPDDLFLMERNFAKAELPVEVWPFDHPEAAKAFFQTLAQSQLPLPRNAVLFCDIKMPILTGFELVEWIRAQPALQTLRIYMVSGSNETVDRDRAKALAVNGYCVKFPTPDILRRIVENTGPIAVCEV